MNMILSPPLFPSEEQNPNLPVTDPIDVPASDVSNSDAFDVQTTFHVDPDVDSRKRVDPITHSVSTNSVIDNSRNTVTRNPHQVNSTITTVPQPVYRIPKRCELCDVDCCSKDAFSLHILGKEHKAKYQVQTHNKLSTAAKGEKPVIFSSACVVCNLAFTCIATFNLHLSGGQHAAQVRANCRQESYKKLLATKGVLASEYPQHGMVLSVAAFSHYISRISLPQDHIIDDQFLWCGVCCMYFSRDNATSQLGEDNSIRCESYQKKKITDPFPRCEACNIFCTDNDSLAEHDKGKKHLRKLLVSGSMKTPEKNKETGADKIEQSDLLKFESGISPMVLPQDNKSVTYDRDLRKANAEQIGKSINLLAERSLKLKQTIEKKQKELNNQETNTSAPASTQALMAGVLKISEARQGENQGPKNENVTGTRGPREVSGNKNQNIIEGGADGTGHKALREDIKTIESESERIKPRDGYLVKCEICNIILRNISASIIKHNTGKKHLKEMTKLGKKETDTNISAATLFRPEPTTNTEVIQGNIEVLKSGSATELQVPSLDSENKKRKISESDADGIDPVFTHDTENKRQKITEGNAEAVPETIKTNESESAQNKLRGDPRSVRCEVCNVSLPKTDANIMLHNTGKKHLTELKKLEKKETDTITLVTTDMGHGPTKCPEVIQGETEGLKKSSATESQVPRVDSENKKRKIIEDDLADGNRIYEVSCELSENEKQKIMEGYAEKKELSEVLPEDNQNIVHESDTTKIKANHLENSEVRNIDCPSHTLLVKRRRRRRSRNTMLKKLNKIATISSASPHAPVTSVPLIIAEVGQGSKNENAILTAPWAQAPSSTDAPYPTDPSVLVPELMKNQEACERHGENEGLKNETVIIAPDSQMISTILSPEVMKKQDPNHGEIEELKNEFVTESQGPREVLEMEMEMVTMMKEAGDGDTSTLVTNCLEAIQGETEGLKKGSATESQVPRVESENKKRKIIEGDGNRVDRVSCKVLEDKKQKIMEGYAEKKELSEVLPEDYKNSDPTTIMADQLENSEVRNIDCPSHTLLVKRRRRRSRNTMLKKLNKIATSTSASTHAPVTSGLLIIAEVSQVSKNENAILTEPSSTEAQFLTSESVLVPELLKNQEACDGENEGGLKNEIVIIAPDLQVISTSTPSTDAPVTIVFEP